MKNVPRTYETIFNVLPFSSLFFNELMKMLVVKGRKIQKR